MKLFIGIEAVGMRFSAAVASDEEGNVLSSARGRPMAFHTMPRDELRLALRDLLLELLAQIGRSLDDLHDSTLCIGLTGVTFAFDALKDLPNEFQTLDLNVGNLICTGDAEIIFASHAQSDTGSVLIAHMGSTAYVTKDGNRWRFGGWGPALGDEGSGFWLGRRALRQVAFEHDTQAPASTLWKQIDQWLSDEFRSEPMWTQSAWLWLEYRRICEESGLDPRSALFAFAHALCLQSQTQWRTTASGLGIPLVRAAKQKDDNARMILKDGAHELAIQYARNLQVAKSSINDGPLVLYGGLVTRSDFYRDLVLKELEEKFSSLPKVLLPGQPGTMRPVCGALLFALGHSDSANLKLPDKSIIDNLVVKQARRHSTKGHLFYE